MKKSFFILSLATLLFAACSSDDSAPGPNPDPTPDPPAISEGKTLEPNVGGRNQNNQVYIDLSTESETVVRRDTWDLGFASSTNRVILNGSIWMAAKQLETTNIDEVQQPDNDVAVGFGTLATLGYVDDPTGVLSGNGGGVGTSIAEISSNDEDNKVYLVNLGKVLVDDGNDTPGSPNTGEGSRGWKKIRITRSGDDYVLQYADLDATTHKSVTISKNSDYNFTFFSFDTENVVNVQPQKNKWDLNFTVFTNYTPYGQIFVTYTFSDFVTSNIHGNTRVYKVNSTEEERDALYDSFTASSVEEAKFAESASEQRVIGASWRNAVTSVLENHVFYVVKDADGNLYKLKFLALTNDNNVRGHSVFEYKLLK